MRRDTHPALQRWGGTDIQLFRGEERQTSSYQRWGTNVQLFRGEERQTSSYIQLFRGEEEQTSNSSEVNIARHPTLQRCGGRTYSSLLARNCLYLCSSSEWERTVIHFSGVDNWLWSSVQMKNFSRKSLWQTSLLKNKGPDIVQYGTEVQRSDLIVVLQAVFWSLFRTRVTTRISPSCPTAGAHTATSAMLQVWCSLARSWS